MKVNNRDFSEFQASIVSFSPTSMEFNQDILISDASYYPIMGTQTMKPQTRELVVDFTSEEDISDFSVEVSKETVFDFDDGYLYHCYPLKQGTVTEEAFGAYTAVYAFYTLKQKPLIVEELVDNIVNHGNLETNAIFELTASVDLNDVLVGDYKIHDLKANKTLVIDGIQKLIYYEDEPNVSAFENVEIYRFPKLHRGENTIVKGSEKLQVIVKYYPTFM